MSSSRKIKINSNRFGTQITIGKICSMFITFYPMQYSYFLMIFRLFRFKPYHCRKVEFAF